MNGPGRVLKYRLFSKKKRKNYPISINPACSNDIGFSLTERRDVEQVAKTFYYKNVI